MRILLVGAGGVGTAFARIAARRPFAELVIADYDLGRAQRAAAAREGYEAVRLDARDEQATAGLLTRHRCDVLMNATDPRFVMPLFRAALRAGTYYLDMAMSLSYPHPDDPYRQTGVKLGDEQFAMAPEWEESGKLALAGIGVEPGLSDVFARYAADELFSEIAELGVRDGANLEVAGYDFAPTFSIWTDGRIRVPGGGLADGGEPGGRAGADRLGRLVRIRRARPRGAAATAVPRLAQRLRLAVGVRRAHARRQGVAQRLPAYAEVSRPARGVVPGSGWGQVSARICWSTLVVFATGSAWRQSCSMTSR